MNGRRLIIAISILANGLHATSLPATMRAVRTSGACGPPFSCVGVVPVKTPALPGEGEVLIRVHATSVNPSDVDRVEAGVCQSGCGADVAGTIVSCPTCKRLKEGDAVWALGNPAYAEYIKLPESMVALKPESLDFHSAGTIPEAGLTSYLSLKRTGALPGEPIARGSPWATGNFSNLTVLVTAGAGGTGVMGIELAKAWGAKHIVTSSTGVEGIAFVKSLGATFVVDYHVQNIFDALPENSVDIVYDNYGAEGTADKAMRAIRPGGMYLMLPHGDCFGAKTQGPPCISDHPKEGVRQLNYATGADFEEYGFQGLNDMKDLFDAKLLSPRIAQTFAFQDVAKAFAASAGSGSGGVGHHHGKISITVAEADVTIFL
jgi:NADPH:quinone reductase-like Zn-dependent oxidoreductase|eukprot:TRINITY_DN13680_c0_g1_i1.p1 TRINITY_DN13680_c0_g1~~TRINITY_DN13680_c0_g1_i1.p1  ORF type:complete len:375 (-),score=57.58 TRINITY_DN13680_c0_g1_i1:115-1239(-)